MIRFTITQTRSVMGNKAEYRDRLLFADHIVSVAPRWDGFEGVEIVLVTGEVVYAEATYAEAIAAIDLASAE